MQQSAVFGEDLHLIRRIEADVGGNEIRITDRVVNHGFYKTPHMYCYHINVGHPVLDEGSRYLAPIRDVVWAAHAGVDYRKQGVGYRTLSAPKLGCSQSDSIPKKSGPSPSPIRFCANSRTADAIARAAEVQAAAQEERVQRFLERRSDLVVLHQCQHLLVGHVLPVAK